MEVLLASAFSRAGVRKFAAAKRPPTEILENRFRATGNSFMITYVRTIAAVAMFLCVSTSAMAGRSAGRGTSHSIRSNTKHAVHSTHTRASRSDASSKRRNSAGSLSYNEYWKAANSPNPPRTNQNYSRYWEKMQAWQRYHDR